MRMHHEQSPNQSPRVPMGGVEQDPWIFFSNKFNQFVKTLEQTRGLDCSNSIGQIRIAIPGHDKARLSSALDEIGRSMKINLFQEPLDPISSKPIKINSQFMDLKKLAESLKRSDTSRLAAFTLIELLVVVAIIGILASVVLANLNTVRAKARDAKRLTELRSIRSALELYYLENGSYPQYKIGSPVCNGGWAYPHPSPIACWNDLAVKLSPYISTLPRDPLNNYPADYSWEGYDYNAPSDGSKYCLLAKMELIDASKGDKCYGSSGVWYCLGAYTSNCTI